MANDASFDVTRTALLAMDCQTGIVSIYAEPQQDFIARASRAIRAARAAGILVISVQVGFRPGLPEVSPRNKLFAALKSSPQHQKLFQGAAGEVHPELGIEPTDVVVIKHRISAFAGTDLDMVLRAKGIENLVLFGIATSGVVLSTLVDASDSDYKITVIQDCCADLDLGLHAALVERLFPQRGEVLTTGEFEAALLRAR
ncbi:MAG: cysteine hydrolase [Acidobacteriaceae bacterium]|nr:cysteine hydrolase [Acidobacteriaceae bacterium]